MLERSLQNKTFLSLIMQTSVIPYLNFNGNCREAMTFYKEALNANLEIMDMGDSPMEVPETSKDHVMHSILTLENITIMASDTMPGQPITFGNSVSLSINCTSREQADRFFNNLKLNGNILMPLQDTFWGAYFGMITDRFGINWLFNYDEVK